VGLSVSSSAASEATIARGTSEDVVVTRTSTDVAYPLAVSYAISGTADNFDDFDGLHGFVIIPAGETTAAIPIKARDKCGAQETVTITLSASDTYAISGQAAATVTLLAAVPR